MAKNLDQTHRPLLEAIAFAARAHQGHAFRVCLIVHEVFGVDEPEVLTAAVLHDTVEDTTTDFDDLEEKFGGAVASWVSALSKDKRLPEKKREKAYCEGLKDAPWQVKVCKLADILDNMMDASHMPTDKRARTLKNARRYLEALKSNLPEEAHRPWVLVSQYLSDHEAEIAKGTNPGK
jgi:guanosine-3',5'-bis(diphosphate) 3'-pyrophosphohydrolase